jgi:hypothetical protein
MALSVCTAGCSIASRSPASAHVEFDYAAEGAQRYLMRIRWSVFRLEFEYEPRRIRSRSTRPVSSCPRLGVARGFALHPIGSRTRTLMRTYRLTTSKPTTSARRCSTRFSFRMEIRERHIPGNEASALNVRLHGIHSLRSRSRSTSRTASLLRRWETT